MKNVRKALLVGFAALSLGSGFAVGCGGDDTSNGGNPLDGGGKDGLSSSSSSSSTSSSSGGTDAGADTSPPPLATGPIDRMGRPGINTLGIDLADKQKYNQAASWATPPAFIAPEFNAHLKALDLLALGKNWPDNDAGEHPLVGPLGGHDPYRDILVVDVNKTCPDKGSHLDIELFLLGFYSTLPDGGPGPGPYTTCGGRTPNDDVIDHALSALVGGPGAIVWTPNFGGGTDPIGDCVSAATKPASLTFPYLADPN